MAYADLLKDIRFKVSGIYMLIIADKFYIGSAVDIRKRLLSHINDLSSKRHKNIHLQRAFLKHKKIEFDIVEEVKDCCDLIKREQHYIDTLNPQYNIARTAGSMLGFKHSDKTKRLISENQKGRKLTKETIRRMKESKKGWSPTEAQRKNYSLSKIGDKNPWYKAGDRHPQYGVKRSGKTKERISKTLRKNGSLKGMNNPASRSGVLYDCHTGKNYIFQSLKPLCKYLGLNYKGVMTALYNKRFYLDRYYFSYANIPRHIYTRFNRLDVGDSHG